MQTSTALILSGGGARGAYQVGVLKGLAEILPEKKLSPFQVLSGVSAGAINCAKLATDIDDFSVAVEKLVYLWSQIKVENVFKTDFLSLNKFSLGLFGDKKLNSLLDTSPLQTLLESQCDFAKIDSHLKNKIINSVILTANNYDQSSAVSFIETLSEFKTWKDSRRQALITKLNVNHVLASSAIPMLFPPIQIQNEFFGDGCVRNSTPCSPAIRMGANRLFVIGVRTQMDTEKNLQSDSNKQRSKAIVSQSPSMIKILNTLLNAVLLDSVEQDVLRIQRINEIVRLIDIEKRKKSNIKEIPALCISPSRDIGEIARSQAHHLPRLLRMTISAFGNLDEAGEILSYLLFDPQFCKILITMGYEDALEAKPQILDFFDVSNRI